MFIKAPKPNLLSHHKVGKESFLNIIFCRCFFRMRFQKHSIHSSINMFPFNKKLIKINVFSIEFFQLRTKCYCFFRIHLILIRNNVERFQYSENVVNIRLCLSRKIHFIFSLTRLNHSLHTLNAKIYGAHGDVKTEHRSKKY